MATPRCPICKHLALDSALLPFCAERCRTIDLARWLDGAYRFANATDEPSDESPHEGDEDR
jgi:endogenous inhibitor of DNA gyrase (YacG/DUF329 family)